MIGAALLFAFLAIVGATCIGVAVSDAAEAWHHERTEAHT